MSNDTLFMLWGIGGYLLGSIPFGLVLCYLAGYGDIRKIGSGNIGATNVLRTGNKWLALLTVLLDASKAGIIAWAAYHFMHKELYIWIRYITYTNVVAAMYAGAMAVVGHNFPIWLKFKGGKGVASAFGFVLANQPILALIALVVWVAMAFIYKYSSLAALTAAATLPIFSFFIAEPIYTIFYTALAILIIYRHRANIRRLRAGEESKIHFKKQA